MLEPDQWESVLGSVTGTVYRGTERVSSNTLFDLLKVGPGPVTRQKVGTNELKTFEFEVFAYFFIECSVGDTCRVAILR